MGNVAGDVVKGGGFILDIFWEMFKKNSDKIFKIKIIN